MSPSIDTLCMGCFAQRSTFAVPCPVCGYNEKPEASPPHQLRQRTILNGKYLIGKVLGEGGFGITYLGWDLNLDLRVAIKEYYPAGYVTRETTSVGNATVQPFTGSQGDFFFSGRDKFINEAKTLAKFFSLPGIVSIKDYFLENGTAYISMEYIDGQTLKSHLAQKGGKLPAAQVFDMMKPVMAALAEVHKTGLIHRDISPDNIMISKDNTVKLLDFGAARDFTESGNKSLSIMLKPGFAPEEQYRSKGVQGPWTDVYALCATMYRCITGVTPDESVERVRKDEVKPPSVLGIAIDRAQEAALMAGMAVLQERRPQNVEGLQRALYSAAAPQPVGAAVQPSSMPPVYTPPPQPIPQPVPQPMQYQPPPPMPQPVQQPVPYPMSNQGYTPPIQAKKSKAGLIASIIGGVCLVSIAAVLLIFTPWSSDEPSGIPSTLPSIPQTSWNPPSTAPISLTEDILGSWTTMYEDVYVMEYGFNRNGEYYGMMYDPDDIDYLITSNIMVIEGTYTVIGNDLYLTPLWEIAFDYEQHDISPYSKNEEWTSALTVVNDYTLRMVDPDGSVNVFTKTTPSYWDFGQRDWLGNRFNPDQYVRNITLGEFTVQNNDNPAQQKGWATHGIELDSGYLSNSWSAWEFTSSRYLILEFYDEPDDPFQFVWRGYNAYDGWNWVQTNDLRAQGNHLVIDLYDINGYYDYITYPELLIYVCYWDDSWLDLPLKDAYFADSLW